MKKRNLSEVDSTFLENLKATDFGPIAFKLMNPDDGPGWTLEQVTRGIEQYRRFLMLKHFYPHTSIVPTREIDKVWHCHILDTEKYREDCQKLFDQYLDHFPYLGIRDEADRENLDKSFNETQSLFEELFGAGALG